MSGDENNVGTGDTEKEPETGRELCFRYLMTVVSWILIILFFPLALPKSLRVLLEYERAVVFRLGRMLPESKGPGLIITLPCIDDVNVLDLRTINQPIKPQELLTGDSVSITVHAVVFFRIDDPMIAKCGMDTYRSVVRLRAATTIREGLGRKSLTDILTKSEPIIKHTLELLNKKTMRFGVKSERIDFKRIHLPADLQRAMAVEAETNQQAKAKVIAAHGEQMASRALKEAADVINNSPAALQLRYLQTMGQVAVEQNSTILFPLPMNILP